MLWWSLVLPIVGWVLVIISCVLFIVKTVIDLFIPEPHQGDHDSR